MSKKFNFDRYSNYPGDNPQSGVNLSTLKKPETLTDDNENSPVFDFKPYKEYPGPDPKAGVSHNKK